VSHYKSNVRDQSITTYSRCSAWTRRSARASTQISTPTPPARLLGEIARLAEGPVAESFATATAIPRPSIQDVFGHAARAVQEVGARHARRRLGPRSSAWMRNSAACRAQGTHVGAAQSTSRPPTPQCGCTRGGAGFANILYHLGTEEQKKWATICRRARLGLDDGAD